jgi:hypothetical protein
MPINPMTDPFQIRLHYNITVYRKNKYTLIHRYYLRSSSKIQGKKSMTLETPIQMLNTSVESVFPIILI